MTLSELARRATLRKRRLHACGCVRLNLSPRVTRKWVDFVAVCEEYADGKTSSAVLSLVGVEMRRCRSPAVLRKDLRAAFQTDGWLKDVWERSVFESSEQTTNGPTDQPHPIWYRVLQDLIGPLDLSAFDPAWRTSTVVALAQQMYDTRDFAAMPILGDALQDAGCDHADILDHCRSASPHVRGCWVVDLVLGKE